MLEAAFELHCSAGEGLSLHGSCVPITRKWAAWRGMIADQYLNFHQQFARGVWYYDQGIGVKSSGPSLARGSCF
jgi:hypothetical protein